MPWFKTLETVPPKDKELLFFKDGKRFKEKLNEDELYKEGKVSKDYYPYWAYLPSGDSLADPAEETQPDLKGDNATAFDDDVVPKLVKEKSKE